MKNLKTIGIVFAILVVVIIIAVFFKDNWLPILNNFLVWIQGLLGIDPSKAFTFNDQSTVNSAPTGIV